ncbi:MAG: glycosyltransferase family 2 protein [Sumerlaeia bacterium]
MPRLFVFLPAYNEEACLPPLMEAFAELFAQLPADRDPLLIVVDDGSKDRTAAVARETAERTGLAFDLVQHEVNRGLGGAIKTGLRRAAELSATEDDVVVCMDADNTHPPRFIVPMEEALHEHHADIVIASRYRQGSEQHGVPLNRQLMSYGARWLFTMFLNVPGVRDYTCGYRAYRIGIVKKSLEHYGDDIITRAGFACTDQLLVNMVCLGAKCHEVPFILRYDQKEGESKLALGTTIKETLALLWAGNRRLAEARKAGQR